MENDKNNEEIVIKRLEKEVKQLEKRIFSLEKEKKNFKFIPVNTYLDTENIV